MSTINPPGCIGVNDASLLNSFDKSECGSSFRVKNGGSSNQLSPVSEFSCSNSFLVKQSNQSFQIMIKA